MKITRVAGALALALLPCAPALAQHASTSQAPAGYAPEQTCVTWTGPTIGAGTLVPCPSTSGGGGGGGGSSSSTSRSLYKASSGGTGYSSGDVLDRTVTSNPASGAVTGSYWINLTTGTLLASAPTAGSYAAYSSTEDTLLAAVTKLSGILSALQGTPPVQLLSLPAYAATPTFNLGTLNGAATGAKQDTIATKLDQLHTDMIAPTPAGTNLIGSIGNTAFGAKLQAADGSPIGTPSAPVRTDPTGTTAQPISGSVTVLNNSDPATGAKQTANTTAIQDSQSAAGVAPNKLTGVQGVAGGTPIPVDPLYRGSATDRGATVGTTAVTIMAANTARRGFAIQNQSSSATCYMSGSATATADYHSLMIPAGQYWETPDSYTGTGAISVICSAASTPVYARER